MDFFSFPQLSVCLNCSLLCPKALYNKHPKNRRVDSISSCFGSPLCLSRNAGSEKGPKENNAFAILFLFTDGKTDEFLQMKVFNEDFRVSDSQMHAMLKEANLTGHGYKKEVTIKQKQNADNGKLEHEVLSFCV